MILFRPVGKAELDLIITSGYKAFPPRLPEQPIFYPVLNEKYAAEIAQKWNTKDKNSGFQGYVTRFEIDDRFISKYKVQTVGASYHQELWVPAEELDSFNSHIIGKIEVVNTMNIDNLIGNDFRGSVLICVGGETVLQKSYGYADLPNKIPNDIDTKFATASAGKVFVAVGILQLIEKGLLGLEHKIGDIFDFDLKQIDPNITVEELLTHTSGIPDYFDESVMDDYEELWVDFPNYKIRSNSDLLPLFIDKPMMYPRGSKFQYNNTGFVMLAMIIEKITGKLFDEYLEQNVFKPCNMTDTGYYELDRLPAKCAANYIFDEKRNEYRTNIFSVDAKGTGAGGAFTTLNDIRLFWDCLLSGKLISKQMVENMIANHSGEAKCYGYGIWLRSSGENLIPYFQGCDPGVSFVSCYDIQKKLLVILMSNYGDNAWKLLKSILECFAK